jgi:hypothetical protein
MSERKFERALADAVRWGFIHEQGDFMMTSRPIQMEVCPDGQGNICLYVLLEDGRIFQYADSDGWGWEEVRGPWIEGSEQKPA